MYNCSYSAAGGLSWPAARLHDKTKHLYACVELGLGISRAFSERTPPRSAKKTLNSTFTCVWPSTKRNLYVNQLTIFFCSLCHCSLTSFLSLSSSFFLVRRGCKKKNNNPQNTQKSSFWAFCSIPFPSSSSEMHLLFDYVPAWICCFGVLLRFEVPAGCIQCHFWKQSCRSRRKAWIP